MNHKKILGIIFVVALVFTLIGIVDPPSFRICTSDCDEFMFYLALSLPLLIITPILFFLRREVFVAWAKFAGIAFPIMLGILVYTYTNEPIVGGWITGADDDAQIASGILPLLFLLLSLAIIGWKSYKLRGK